MIKLFIVDISRNILTLMYIIKLTLKGNEQRNIYLIWVSRNEKSYNKKSNFLN